MPPALAPATAAPAELVPAVGEAPPAKAPPALDVGAPAVDTDGLGEGSTLPHPTAAKPTATTNSAKPGWSLRFERSNVGKGRVT